jgi:hypothetical protein
MISHGVRQHGNTRVYDDPEGERDKNPGNNVGRDAKPERFRQRGEKLQRFFTTQCEVQAKLQDLPADRPHHAGQQRKPDVQREPLPDNRPSDRPAIADRKDRRRHDAVDQPVAANEQ